MILRRKNEERARDDVIIVKNEQNQRKNINVKIIIAIICVDNRLCDKIYYQEIERMYVCQIYH